MDSKLGAWLLNDVDGVRMLAGYDLVNYIPVFDPETGDYIDDEEEVYGHEQMLVIAGPFDSYYEADAWGDAHKGEYGL